MSIYEIHLNQKGINSLDTPRQVEVEIGTDLELRLINHGHPVHLTLSALNPKTYTHFIHENLYIDDEVDYQVPIRKDSKEGSFDMEVIAGYGSRRSKFSVIVKKPAEKVEKKEEPQPAPPLFPLPEQVKNPPVLLATLSVIAYALWILAFTDNVLLNVFAFLMLLGGFVVAWSQRAS